MSNTGKTYAAILILVVLSLIYYENTKKTPVNWFPSYVAKHKIPYGTYVLRNEMQDIFPNSEIKNINYSPYIYLQDEEVTGTYFFVDQTLNFGNEEFIELMKFVERGNDVFISTHGMNIDTLNLRTEQLISGNFNEKVFFELKNTIFSKEKYSYDRPFKNYVFSKVDTIATTVLGVSGYENTANQVTEEGVNFISYSFGKGTFYLHTFPEAFTNYALLKSPNDQYAANILSYLRDDIPILWDSYYKTGKSRISSPMHYLLSSDYLRWAWYTVLIGVLMFIIFEGKRKQRAIPIIRPLINQTLAFTRTIAGMYFEKQDHKNVAEQKISYLLEYIRTKLHIPTTNIDTVFYNYVASRSGNSLEDVKKLFDFCESIHLSNQISSEDLIRLNKMIEKFKKPIEHGK